ncbi:MAG TPA: asparagine synthase (glutamine-hydrolyzing) [Candidatus Paceibacterota bacterium]
MCGFAGIINREQSLSKQQVSEIARLVSFRGPDHTGISIYDTDFIRQELGETAFFFNRLSIIDLDSRSNQPFEDDRYTLLFNGEIYNYQSIKKELQDKKIVFHTTSDTEVLFRALILFGNAIIEKLNGMFAFFFIDRLEQKYILARDRMGIKPLCYSFQGKSFVFGSELDSIIRLMPKKPQLSSKSIDLYIALQYIPTPHTIWEGVAKLPPGCYIEGTINDLKKGNQINPKIYWDAYKQITEVSSIQDQDLELLLVNSIRSQMHADVPLGFFLSSGIDSSLLAAVVNKHLKTGQQFNFFTIAFDQNIIQDESNDAEFFLNGFKNDNFVHHRLNIDSNLIKNCLISMYDFIDEPFGDYATMLNYGISEKAKEYVTVALSGDGADELFWGYSRYNQWSYNKSHCSHSKLIKPLQSAVNYIPESRIKNMLQRKMENDPFKLYFYQITSKLRNINAISNDDTCWWSNGIEKLYDRDDLASIIDLKTYLPDCMFYKVDRSSMGASLEVRVPYLDNDIIDYGLSLNLKEKTTSRFPNKAPLNEMLSKLAPHYNINLPKKGFSLPLREWISSDWKELTYSFITKDKLQSLGFPKSYYKLLDNHYEKGIDNSIELWHLLNLMIWVDNKNKIL